MQRTLLVTGVLPFISAFLGGLLAFSLVVPQQVTAQSSQAQEVRASVFTLVGPDGATLARLEPSGGSNGRLSLYGPAGTVGATISGSGSFHAFDQDGNVAFRAGRTFDVGTTTGQPPLNGVVLCPGGSVTMLPPLP